MVYEAYGGTLDEPQRFQKMSEARSAAAEAGARVRSMVVQTEIATAAS